MTNRSPQRTRAHHNRWSLPAATVLCLISTSVLADPANDIKQVRQALGGPAWDRVRSLAIEYSFAQGTRTGTVRHLEDVEAGRYVTTYRLPSRTTSSGFDGINSWDQNSGVYYTYGDVDSALAAQNESYRTARALLYPDRHAAVITDAPDATDDHKRYRVLRISPEGGRPFKLWLDPRSHLPTRIIEQGAERQLVTDLGDYRRVDGIMVPGTIISEGETLKATQVVVNVRIADAEFAMPRASRPLHPFAGEVKVPIRVEGRHIVVPLTIDGLGPFDCEFDSGGGFILSPSAAAALKLNGEGSSRAYGGGEGFATTTLGMTHSVKIGSYDLGPLRYATLDIDRGHQKRVLIGEPLLQRAVVRLDFDTMTMIVMPFDRFDYRGMGAIVPFHFQDNQPEVYGNIDGIAARMTIDTGDSGSLLLIAPFARRYHLAERYHATIPYQGSAVTSTYGYWARAEKVQLDDADGEPVVEVHQPLTRISNQHSGFDANRYVSANLGIGILKQFNLTFDYARRRIIFERNHNYGASDPFNRAGFTMQSGTAGRTVRAVYAGSPAEAAGLKVGTRILSLNGRKTENLSQDEISALLIGAVGSELIVELQEADGSTHSRTLHLRDIL